MLLLLWYIALGMVAAALCWMAALVVGRFFREAAERRRAIDRAAVNKGLVLLLQGSADAARRLAPYVGRAELMAGVLLDFLSLVRGGDRQRVLDGLRDLGVDEALRRRIRRGSRAGRLLCLEALSAFPGPETEAALQALSSDRDPDLRLAALRGLVDSDGAVDVGRLLDEVTGGGLPNSPLVSDLIAAAVARDAPAALDAVERTDLSPTARAMLLEALGSAGDYGAIPRLVEAAHAPDAEVRAAAVRALGRLRHPAGGPAFDEALADEDWLVRGAAAEAAGGAGLLTLADRLAGALADEVWWVRFQAAEALAAMGQKGLERLRAAAESGPDVAKRAAALALAERSGR